MTLKQTDKHPEKGVYKVLSGHSSYCISLVFFFSVFASEYTGGYLYLIPSEIIYKFVSAPTYTYLSLVIGFCN